jgi:hypothetical protein
MVKFEGMKSASWITRLRYRVCGRRAIGATVVLNRDPRLTDLLGELDGLRFVIIRGRPITDDEPGYEAIDLRPVIQLRRLTTLQVSRVNVDIRQANALRHLPCCSFRETNLSSAEEARLNRWADIPRVRGASYPTLLRQLRNAARD